MDLERDADHGATQSYTDSGTVSGAAADPAVSSSSDNSGLSSWSNYQSVSSSSVWSGGTETLVEFSWGSSQTGEDEAIDDGAAVETVTLSYTGSTTYSLTVSGLAGPYSEVGTLTNSISNSVNYSSGDYTYTDINYQNLYAVSINPTSTVVLATGSYSYTWSASGTAPAPGVSVFIGAGDTGGGVSGSGSSAGGGSGTAWGSSGAWGSSSGSTGSSSSSLSSGSPFSYSSNGASPFGGVLNGLAQSRRRSCREVWVSMFPRAFSQCRGRAWCRTPAARVSRPRGSLQSRIRLGRPHLPRGAFGLGTGATAQDEWLKLQNEETAIIQQFNAMLGTQHTTIDQFSSAEQAELEEKTG